MLLRVAPRRVHAVVARQIHTFVPRMGGHLSMHSAKGNWSVFSMRQHYAVILKTTTDPTLADHF